MTSNNDTLTFIKEQIANNKIVLFMKGNATEIKCGFSARVARLLESLKVDFKAIDVLQSDELREKIKEYTNWPTLPQLYVNGKFIGGCDIVEKMYKDHYQDLVKLLKE